MAQKEQKDRTEKKSHQFQGAVQTGEVMSAFLRGDKDVSLLSLYKPSKEAGKSMHSKSGWKDILAKHDQLAESDLSIVKQQEEVPMPVCLLSCLDNLLIDLNIVVGCIISVTTNSCLTR